MTVVPCPCGLVVVSSDGDQGPASTIVGGVHQAIGLVNAVVWANPVDAIATL